MGIQDLQDQGQKLNEEIKNSLKNWRSIVKEYQAPSNRKALIQIATSFLPFIALWSLTYFLLNWSLWLVIPLGMVNAFFLVRIFIIQHDCGHQSFFKSRKWNNYIGFLCSFFSFIPFRYWAKVHNFHHGHSGQIETWDIGDIPTLTVKQYAAKSWRGKLAYRIWRTPAITFGIAPMYYLLVSNRMPVTRIGTWKNLISWQVRGNLAIALAYVALGYLLGWKAFLLIQFFTLLCFGVIAFWFFFIQHQHEHSYKKYKEDWEFVVAAIRGSTYYKLPRLFQWLSGNIGIHHIHHLSSMIPNYNLEKCMRENPVLNKHVTVLSFWQSLKLMTHKLWDEEQERMISFREYSRLKGMGLV